MAKPLIKFITPQTVYFSLSNQPQFTICVDRDFFKEKVFGLNCWYVKIKRNNKPYVAKGIRVDNKTQTYFLHWEVFGGKCSQKSGFILDHENRRTLDNRKRNLRKITQDQNIMNSDRVENAPRAMNNVPREYSLSFLKKTKRYISYYKKGKYIASSKNIETVIEKIKLHQRELNQ